jgi:hypothetical protein
MCLMIFSTEHSFVIKKYKEKLMWRWDGYRLMINVVHFAMVDKDQRIDSLISSVVANWCDGRYKPPQLVPYLLKTV